MKKHLLFMCTTALLLAAASPASASQPPEVSATAEIGVIRPLVHTIQIGENGHELDYVSEGGQELLLPYSRFEVQVLANQRHEIAFLYQPLTLITSTRVESANGILIDDVLFADNSPLDLKYGFDFYRGTYRYRIINSSAWQVSLGGALQIRNASIVFDGFAENDGELYETRVVTQDLGPVPVIASAARRSYENGVFIEATLDGFYAPVRYLNLRDVDVIGWLYDGAVRAGTPLRDSAEAYISLRFLGGGSDGTAGDRSRWTQSKDQPRYTSNNLNLVSLSLGARF